MGLNYSFLTNNPSAGISDYLAKLAKLGIEATREEMYTTSIATIDYLKPHYPEAKRLFLLGTPSMIAEFEKESIAKSNEVTQSIMEYIKEYNSDAKFDFILTKMGGNMLYANEALDITNDVVKGLNAKHSVKK